MVDFARMATDLPYYRSCLLIDADGGRKPFVPDDWQDADFLALDRSWMRVAGLLDGEGVVNRSMQVRPRGHSKTGDAGMMALWALTFATHPIVGVAAGADADQAKLIRNSIERLVRANPEIFHGVIECGQWRITNVKTGSTLEIISSDGASSYGHLVDFVIADEIVHWANNELWISLLSAVAKRSHALLLCITNAGWVNTWQYALMEHAKQHPERWHFSSLDGPCASWITAENLEEQRQLLPRTAFNRLWLNLWIAVTECPLLPPELMAPCQDACLWTDGIPANFHGDLYVGVDIGRTRDRSVIWVWQLLEEMAIAREIVVMHQMSFGNQRAEIERRITKHTRALRIDKGGIGMQLAEELQTAFPRTVEGVQLTVSKQGALAVCIKSRFERETVRIPAGDMDLLQDFGLVEQVETGTGGVPVVKTNRGPTGHADRFWAACLGLDAMPLKQAAIRIGSPPRGIPSRLSFDPEESARRQQFRQFQQHMRGAHGQ